MGASLRRVRSGLISGRPRWKVVDVQHPRHRRLADGIRRPVLDPRRLTDGLAGGSSPPAQSARCAVAVPVAVSAHLDRRRALLTPVRSASASSGADASLSHRNDRPARTVPARRRARSTPSASPRGRVTHVTSPIPVRVLISRARFASERMRLQDGVWAARYASVSPGCERRTPPYVFSVVEGEICLQGLAIEEDRSRRADQGR